MRLVGPDDRGHLLEVEKLAKEMGLMGSIEFIGEVNGARKDQIYREADLFVLPTYSENFGLVIAEALSYGIPVITTRGTPWSSLLKYNCGWWIDIGVNPLATALSSAMALTDQDRLRMGSNGRNYIQSYDWDAIAMSMEQTYRWVLHLGEKPDFVMLN